jgi:hypothetical protein
MWQHEVMASDHGKGGNCGNGAHTVAIIAMVLCYDLS